MVKQLDNNCKYFSKLADARGENHYVALGRTVQQLGSFLLKFCDLTDKEREDIQYTLEQLDRDQNRKY